MGMRIVRALGLLLNVRDLRIIGYSLTLLALFGSMAIAGAAILGTAVHVFRIAAG